MTGTSPYQVAPALSTDDYERLKASIAEKGVVYPVIKDERGEIIDGHHRDKIARELGISYKTETVTGLCEEEKRILAATLNLARRHMTDGQKTLMGQVIEPDVAAMAKRRMAEAGAKAAPGKPATDVATFTPTPPKRTVDEVAATVGLGSGRTYERNKQVIAAIKKEPDAPLLLARVESGELEIDDARKETERREKERQREQANAEQETAKAMLEVVGDPDGKVARARLMKQMADGIYAARQLTILDPESIADALTPQHERQLRTFIPDMRGWLTNIEAAMGRGLRIVKER